MTFAEELHDLSQEMLVGIGVDYHNEGFAFTPPTDETAEYYEEMRAAHATLVRAWKALEGIDW